MIKRMESENSSISMATENQVILTVDGNDMALSIDQVRDLYRMIGLFYDANDLYRKTTEARENCIGALSGTQETASTDWV